MIVIAAQLAIHHIGRDDPHAHPGVSRGMPDHTFQQPVGCITAITAGHRLAQGLCGLLNFGKIIVGLLQRFADLLYG